jgi:type I restriction enzyme S subunit
MFKTGSKLKALWLYYYLNSRIGKFILETNKSGTSQPYLTLGFLRELPILYPSSDKEAEQIIEVLSSLDDKIDLLHRQNKTLEAMAETLFRQWFVEEAEESWEIGKLGDVLESIESGTRPKGGIDPELKNGVPSIGAENVNGLGNYDYSKTKFITNEFFQKMNRGIIGDYDVLIYKDGAYIGRKTMFANNFPYEECCVNEHVFILRGNSRVNQFFLYFLLEQEELEQLNANSAQPGLNQESMRSFKITVPSCEKIERFGDTVKPWIDKIFFNCTQTRKLTKLRDELLPKLMSGDEVRVKMSEAETAVTNQ